MAVCLPDTQDDTPSIPIKLTRVGVTGVKKLLQLERNNKRPIILVPTFDAFVDLPNDQKGVHMSRNPEAISEVLDEVANDSSVEVETLCAKIVSKMMSKHEYAKRVEISMTTDYMFMKESPVTKNKTQEMAKLKAKAVGYREDGEIKIRKSIGAEVIGMTVCPCAQESVKESDKNKLLEFLDEETTQKVLDTVTFASHNQRGVGTLLIEVPEDREVKGEDIIEIIEESMSSPVCELLKRPDENATVLNAHKKPVFVEDCVRNMMEKIAKKYYIAYKNDDINENIEKEHFTLVARAMLRLANTVFLYGCSGANLDCIAREVFWKEGLNFNHGTGHGVGYLLNIHEGPINFRWKEGERPAPALEENMVITDEPGIYIEGSHGIRLENELLVRKTVKNEYGQFMNFEILTYVPIDLDAILPEKMSTEEKEMLNHYHKQVYEKVSPYLSEEERIWLKEYTRAVK